MSTYLEGVGLDTATARCISAVAVTSGSLMTRKPVAYVFIDNGSLHRSVETKISGVQ